MTNDECRWVALLARLELGDHELDSLTRQLSAIVDYVNQLSQVSTEGVEPLAHPLPVHNVFRADDLAPSLAVEEALDNAPQRQDGFYVVPAVLD
jgi:aspartyl-tRNA(Asn)/glutamyl-tRNA(Gln) amidotransferase subunit C